MIVVILHAGVHLLVRRIFHCHRELLLEMLPQTMHQPRYKFPILTL